MGPDIIYINRNNEVPEIAVDILKRKLSEKCMVSFSVDASLVIDINIDHKIAHDAYRISCGSHFEITGGSIRGLLFAVGAFIRGCKPGYGFEYNGWNGEVSPDMPYRVVYLPMHFFNYYHSAPINELFMYLEDVALMGYNYILMWYDMHHFTSIDEPHSIEMINRMKLIYKKTESLGMGNMLLGLSNEAFADSPKNLRARSSGGHDGYTSNLAGHYHVELCPNKDGAMKLMLEWRSQVLNTFKDCNIEMFAIGPYDQGGCTCSKCKPWGVNGNMIMAKEISKLVKDVFPDAKILFSTWRFDAFTSGEWEELGKLLASKQDYADLLFSEIQEPGVYNYFTKHGVPGGLPVIGFPEISMIGAVPWGGFGTNPHPSVIQDNWNKARNYVSGGAPYSEGIYEDINKYICSQMYWKSKQNCWDSVKEYIQSEFSADPVIVGEIMELVHIFEETLYRHRVDERGNVHDYPDDNIPRYGIQRFMISNPSRINEAYTLAQHIDSRLPDLIRKSWRWRLFYLRACIDDELRKNDFICNSATDIYMSELITLYYAQKADYACSPPTREVIETKSTGTTFITFDEEEQL